MMGTDSAFLTTDCSSKNNNNNNNLNKNNKQTSVIINNINSNKTINNATSVNNNIVTSNSSADSNNCVASGKKKEKTHSKQKKIDLDEILYIDDSVGKNNNRSVNNDGGNSRIEETNMDQDDEMVLEPKFVDYGSIHPTADISSHHHHHNQLQQHNSLSSHALLSPRSVLLPPLQDDAEQDSKPGRSNQGNKMTQDRYQTQPLLPTTSSAKGDIWSNHTSGTQDYYDVEDDILEKGADKNGDVVIDLPATRDQAPRFPQERCKTLLAAVIMCFNFILTLTSLSLVHDRVPEREVVGPLPDVLLDNIPAYDWALDVSEYIIMVCINTSMFAMVFHKHRFIVFRRIFLIMSLLYLYRAITMYVTVLPLASKTYVCSPRLNNTTPLVVMKRVVHLMSGFGLSVNGKHTFCGDFIYSGHTVVLVFSYLIISEYTPKKFYLVHWLYWVLALVGVIMLQLSHGHYTVDVIIAYYVTTRIFWTYHTLANNANLKQYSPNNLLSRSWWFMFFLYFEGKVGGPVPRQFNWPLPWPRRWHSKSRDS